MLHSPVLVDIPFYTINSPFQKVHKSSRQRSIAFLGTAKPIALLRYKRLYFSYDILPLCAFPVLSLSDDKNRTKLFFSNLNAPRRMLSNDSNVKVESLLTSRTLGNSIKLLRIDGYIDSDLFFDNFWPHRPSSLLDCYFYSKRFL